MGNGTGEKGVVGSNIREGGVASDVTQTKGECLISLALPCILVRLSKRDVKRLKIGVYLSSIF